MTKPRTAVPALAGAVRLFLSRVRHGRRGRLAARIGGGLVLVEIASHSGAGPAAIVGTMAGIVVWLGFAARADIAPPPGR